MKLSLVKSRKNRTFIISLQFGDSFDIYVIKFIKQPPSKSSHLIFFSSWLVFHFTCIPYSITYPMSPIPFI